MLTLSKIATWIAGPALIPGLIMAVLVFGGRMIEARREALIQQGVEKCEANWKLDIALVERDVLQADLRATRAQLNATDVLNMEISTNAAELRKELGDLRTSLAGSDQRCLSDRVRELARGVQGGGSR